MSSSNELSLASLNLNLLVHLDALLAQRSVSAAARSVGVTQSAMSHSLRKLRELTGDVLLEQEGRSLRLTERAAALRPELRRSLLDQIEVMEPYGPLRARWRAQRRTRYLTCTAPFLKRRSSMSSRSRRRSVGKADLPAPTVTGESIIASSSTTPARKAHVVKALG